MFTDFLKKLVQYLFPAANAGYKTYDYTFDQPQKPIYTTDMDVIARTIWGEARGEGYKGMQAVANVIVNRHKTAAFNPIYAIRWGYTWQGICQKAYQFSAWNKNDPNYAQIKNVTTSDATFKTALDIAYSAVNGTLPDIVGGSTYYHTKTIKPSWASGAIPVASIGTHVFYQTSQIA